MATPGVVGSLVVLDVTFEQFEEVWSWKEIPNCPGRYTLDPQKTISQDVKEFMCKTEPGLCDQLADLPLEAWTMRWEKNEVVRDILWAVRIANNCGIVSYQHKTGGFLHTLNSASGFERKLKALHIYDQVFPTQSE